MLQEANGSKRQELLQHANADQINAVSELVLNFLKNKIPVTPPMLAKLQPYKRVLRDLGRRRHSVKNVGRGWFNKKDAACFKDFTRCYVNVLDRPVNPGHMDHPVTRGQSGHRPVERRVSLLEA